jgi:hypothetical protein
MVLGARSQRRGQPRRAGHGGRCAPPAWHPPPTRCGWPGAVAGKHMGRQHAAVRGRPPAPHAGHPAPACRLAGPRPTRQWPACGLRAALHGLQRHGRGHLRVARWPARCAGAAQALAVFEQHQFFGRIHAGMAVRAHAPGAHRAAATAACRTCRRPGWPRCWGKCPPRRRCGARRYSAAVMCVACTRHQRSSTGRGPAATAPGAGRSRPCSHPPPASARRCGCGWAPAHSARDALHGSGQAVGRHGAQRMRGQAQNSPLRLCSGRKALQ